MQPGKRGVLLLNKPPGMTSHDAVTAVKRILEASKTGHSGTLDMNVTGVLLVCVNEAVKTMPVFIGLDKEYAGTMHLHRTVRRKELTAALSAFIGTITQLPPVRSRVSRKPRQRNVYSFMLKKLSGRDAHFVVRCQSGTYVRKLVHDIGETVGGAHLAALRRTKIATFSENECVTLTQLEKMKWECVIPLETVLERIHLKKVCIKDSSVGKIRNGNPVTEQDVEQADSAVSGERIGIFNKKKLIGLGTYNGSRYVAKTDRLLRN